MTESKPRCREHPEVTMVECDEEGGFICQLCGFTVSQNCRIPARVFCREHPDAILVDDDLAGDLICPQCGLIVGDRVIDVAFEWRTCGNENNNSCFGAAKDPLMDDDDMTPMTATGPASESVKDDINTVRSKKGKFRVIRNQSFINGKAEIIEIARKLHLLKELEDRALSVFETVHNSSSVSRHKSIANAAACLYLSCRENKVTRTFKEISSVSQASSKDIGTQFKEILKFLKINCPPITAGEVMPRFCARLYLPIDVKNAAMHIAEQASMMDLVLGLSPLSVAAAAIYMASQATVHKRSSKDVADSTGVSKVTIKKTYKSMLKEAWQLFPAGFNFKTSVRHLPDC